MIHRSARSRWNLLTGTIGLIVLTAVQFFGCASNKQSEQLAVLSLEILETNPQANGSRIVIGGHIRLDRGWHTYWTNPGDAGLAPRLEWRTPKGIQIHGVHFSIPEKIMEEASVILGYADNMWFKAEMAADSTAGDKVELYATLLLCKDVCIPVKCTASIDMKAFDRAGVAKGQPADVGYPQIDSSLRVTYGLTDTTIFLIFPLSEAWTAAEDIVDVYPITQGLTDLTMRPRLESRRDQSIVIMKRPQLPVAPPDTIMGLLILSNMEPQAILFEAVSEAKNPTSIGGTR